METREKFEVLPEIATHLDHGNVFFNEEKKTYASEFSCLHIVACYVNGAWYAFQEQQKIINMQECGAKKIIEILNYEGLFYEDKCDMIKELLK